MTNQIRSENNFMNLRLLSFEGDGQDIADYITDWINRKKNQDECWALIEQMHKFFFMGPQPTDVLEKIKGNEFIDFCLRGRIFWSDGQIEWRRFNNEIFRCVCMIEAAEEMMRPEIIECAEKTVEVTIEDDFLILWGKAIDEAGYKEQRIKGSAEIKYPDVYMKFNSNGKLPFYPILKIRTYQDESSGESFMRMLKPGVADQDFLFSLNKSSKQTSMEEKSE